jgi:hypothetical protein
MVVLDELTIADAPESWQACGFDLEGDVCVVGETRIRLAGGDAGRGLTGWSLRGVAAGADLDGLPTTISDRPPPSEGPVHPNGVAGLDHVVAISPALDRTVAALETAGLDLRRVREEPTPAGAPRQTFFRLGAVILEVVQAIEKAGGVERPAFFWGLAFPHPRSGCRGRDVRRSGWRGPRRCPARPSDRHPAPLRRLGCADRADDPLGVGRPAVGDQLAVAVLGPGAADGEHLEPVRTGLEAADDARRDADQVPPGKLQDLVVEPDPAGPAEDQVGLFLDLVPVAVLGAEAGRVAKVTDAELLGAEQAAGEPALDLVPADAVIDLHQVRLREVRHRDNIRERRPPAPRLRPHRP